MFGKKKTDSFSFGVEDIFALENSDDLVVVGRLEGSIGEGAAAYVTNFGDDDTPVSLTEIKGIEIDHKPVKKAKDQPLALRVENGTKLGIKIATVLHSRDASMSDVHGAYINAIGNGYISAKQMNLTEKDYAAMSLTDLAELRRLFSFLIKQKQAQETEEIHKLNQIKMDEIADQMCKKLLSSKEIFYLKNKNTGEAHLFTQTYRQDGGLVTMPPDILLITKPYAQAWSKNYSAEVFDLVKVENGPDGKGIYNFLGENFFVNGACGVRVIFDNFAIDASKLVEKPDFSNLPEIEIPVTNPDLERWLLLMGQMDKVETEDEQTVYGAYCNLMDQELLKAKFLIPMKLDGPTEKTGANELTIKEDATLSLAVMNGKNDKPAMAMFTDWKRLEMVYPRSQGWSGMVQNIEGVIEKYDVAINATQYLKAGCYIDHDTFMNLKQRENK